jgi:hypothetical protein
MIRGLTLRYSVPRLHPPLFTPPLLPPLLYSFPHTNIAPAQSKRLRWAYKSILTYQIRPWGGEGMRHETQLAALTAWRPRGGEGGGQGRTGQGDGAGRGGAADQSQRGAAQTAQHSTAPQPASSTAPTPSPHERQQSKLNTHTPPHPSHPPPSPSAGGRTHKIPHLKENL